MSAISIINLILISAAITLLFFGLLLCYKYSQNNIYKRYLLGTIVFWIVALSISYYVIFLRSVDALSIEKVDLLNIRGLLFGIPCFLTLVSLPVVVLNAKLLRFSNWIKVASPIAIAVATYFCCHLIAGSDPFYTYSSSEEILQNITTAPVILRILIHLCFIIYIAIAMFVINRAVPLYNQYIKDNIADSDYNVDWVSGLLKRIWFVTIFYFAMRFTGSVYVVPFYLISVMIMFMYIIDMSLFHKMMDGVTPLILNMKRSKWQFVECEVKSESVSAADSEPLSNGWEAISRWMESERPYTNPEFTIQWVVKQFSDTTPAELTEIFKSHGESFQSIVREYRIAYACQIVKERRGDISSKMLYSVVGFSHHSSFTRAFTAVKGMTPSEYIKLERDKS